MPVIFSSADTFAAYLNPKSTPEGLQRLLLPADDELLTAERVSKQVNNSKFDDPSCIAPAGFGSVHFPRPVTIFT